VLAKTDVRGLPTNDYGVSLDLTAVSR
jgi:hypothetical protein